MKTILGLIFSFLILLLVSNPAFARIYKWYDRDGALHISDRFPDQAHQKGGVFFLAEVDVSEPSGLTPAPELIIMNAGAYRSDGEVIVVGEVQNNTPSRVEDVRLQVVVYDLSNKLFNMVWASPEPSVLNVRRSGIFKTYFDDPYKVITKVEIRLTDREGELRGTPAIVYVTEPRTQPDKSSSSLTMPEKTYTPIQELPVSSPPLSTPIVPYTSGSTIAYPSGSIILGYAPYPLGFPGIVIYNRNIFICKQCVKHPKVPLRSDRLVRSSPHVRSESRRTFAREGRPAWSVETFRKGR